MSMSRKKEEELQSKIFSNSNEKEDFLQFFEEDAELYKMVESELNQEPHFSLSTDFAAVTTKKAFRRKKLQSLYKMAAFYAIASVFLIALGGGVFYYFSKETFQDFLSLFSNYGLQIGVLAILIIGIQLIDNVFIKKNVDIFRFRDFV